MISTRFTKRYATQTPIALAAMGFIGKPPLVAAVAEGGGFGMLATGPEPAEALVAAIGEVRRRTHRPFGVNLIVETTAFGSLATEDHVEACASEHVDAVSFFWNLPPRSWVERLVDADVPVWLQTGILEDARTAVDWGASLVIVQGGEAGGHNRSECGLMTLLPLFADAIADRSLILAAGGIADGRGLAAALCLGADGISMGTRFLATTESSAHEEYKRRVVAATERDIARTTIFGPEWPDAPMRVIRNSAVADSDFGPADIGETDIGGTTYTMPNNSAVLPTAGTSGDFDRMCLAAGESAALIHEISCVDEVLRDVTSSAERILDQRASADERKLWVA